MAAAYLRLAQSSDERTKSGAAAQPTSSRDPDSAPSTAAAWAAGLPSHSPVSAPAAAAITTTLPIPGASETASIYAVPRTGTLLIGWLAGAYNVSPAGSATPDAGPWRAAVACFSDGRAHWDGQRLKTEDALMIGDWPPYSARTEALAEALAAKAAPSETDVEAGQEFACLAVDTQGSAYADNVGTVVLNLVLQPAT
jgi:hypothetical protein